MIRLGLLEGFPSQETLDRSYQLDCNGWIVWIVSAGLYRLDHIVLAGLYWYQSWVCLVKLDFILWLVIGWMGRMYWLGHQWEGGGMEGPTLSGSGIGAPPLALEGRQAVVNGDWHQLRWCCKGANYLCWSSKIIQIGCTQIGTNMQYKIV